MIGYAHAVAYAGREVIDFVNVAHVVRVRIDVDVIGEGDVVAYLYAAAII